MQYKSQRSNAIIFTNQGKIKAKFYHGKYIIGSLTTATGAGNYIDGAVQSDTSLNVQRIYTTDLDGNTASCIEMCGQGTLNGITAAGNTLTTLEEGFRGWFFPCPRLTGTTNSVPAKAGIVYEVVDGTVTYDGTTYSAGEQFTTDGSTTATTGSGHFELVIPDDLENRYNGFLTEAFRITHLGQPDEMSGYYTYGQYGYDPVNSETCTDADYIGWTR